MKTFSSPQPGSDKKTTKVESAHSYLDVRTDFDILFKFYNSISTYLRNTQHHIEISCDGNIQEECTA